MNTAEIASHNGKHVIQHIFLLHGISEVIVRDWRILWVVYW